ncbi:MAG: aldo/keto reductase [Thermaerobacter sp.]|nr:aldo/keto reductase [Thermaerobacter sp.]
MFANQVRYGLATREPETTLAAVAARLDTTLMAYSPIRHVLGPDIAVHDVLAAVAHEHGVSPAAVALAWILRPAAVRWVVVVKAANRAHQADNAAALRLTLSAVELDRLDRVFPASGEDLKLQTF